MRSLLLLFLAINSHLAFASETNVSAISHNELIRVIFGLLVVLLIILVLSWVLKKLNTTHLTSSSGFKAIASMALGAKEKIQLLQVGDRYLLIGIASGSITLLHDFGDQLPKGFDPEGKSSFAAVLKSALGKS